MITSDSIFTIEECNEIVGFLKTAGHLFEKQNKDNMSYSKWHLNDHSFKYKNRLQEYVNNKLNISSKDTDIIFIKYSKDDYMGTHVDKNNESEYHRDSMYNFNVRLNDDFEGGEFKLKNKKFIAPIGTIYHYSSSTPHSVTKIKKGTRYMLLFYLRERNVTDFKKSII